MKGHLDLVRKELEKLSKASLPINISTSWWCCLQQKIVGLVVGRLGVRPSQSKVDAAFQLTRADTVAEGRAMLNMTGYLKMFVPRYSASLAQSRIYFGKSVFRRNGKEAEGTVG